MLWYIFLTLLGIVLAVLAYRDYKNGGLDPESKVQWAFFGYAVGMVFSLLFMWMFKK